ncbi:TIGR02680 family protein [Gelria sp. Kuro-4]|uniref:TIGR02680 family protein n=1 Tax=Gelria sp. Kuro-4 TaxID=2796927 RepID=UPI001BF034A8|nr:TIGR02680 family protein [Gelria sp. Kuro-4]BCV24257.1 TIGR02680 family protein [Gelria sp. Kuro-4]
MATRWHIERAGLLNFWLYDEAEFQFSAGRLILRGANGSGKSVTMQSLIPLVLDGDKRPWRLDPFGSRDRRIEYYLLGDADSSTTERTSYLYLEFHHPEQAHYLTIGIGLRARRSSPVGFWGFALTDNRRIGRDFLLYERDFSQGKEAHIPLTRPQLEAAIGSGGWVVTEQGEYKRRVNKLLFGYEDLQSYDELLDLLIQIRSPKLSKDFKPSTIYEILTSALPPLKEDDLRPLAEVLGDMNEISDRLSELAAHRREAERLSRAYAQYNEFQLYAVSRTLSERWEERRARMEAQAAKEQEAAALDEAFKERQDAVTHLGERLTQVRAEYETLSASEALDKERDLERVQADEKEVSRALAAAEERLRDWDKRRRQAEEVIARQEPALQAKTREQQDLLQAMEERARAAEFLTHAAYQSYWQAGTPSGTDFWPAWRRDIEERRAELEKALDLARAEARLKGSAEQAERELSAARKVRDEREAALRRGEEAAEKARDRVQEEIFAWKKELHRLPLSPETLQEVLYRLAHFDELPYDEVKEPVATAYRAAARDLDRLHAKCEAARDKHQEAKEELQRRLEEWRSRREPEPPRSAAREAARRRRQAAGEPGAPLFAACEFRPDLPEAARAALEAALQQAGLLDAWVTAEGLALEPGEEEVWIKPQPQLSARTLADYLVPTPPEGSGLAAVDAVLRTIRVDHGGEAPGGYVAADGTFQLGPLCGQAVPKPRAEFIGKESRRRTRLAEMERLQQLIAAEEAEIAALSARLAELEAQAAALTREYEDFPTGEELRKAFRELERLRLAFDSARKEEEERHKRHQTLVQEWSAARARLHQFMAGWGVPRTEAGLSAALDALRSYEKFFGDLRLCCEEWRRLHGELTQARAGRSEAEKNLVRESEQAANLKERQQDLLARRKTLEGLLRELGLYDLHARLARLKEEEEKLSAALKQEEKAQHEVDKRRAVCRSELQNLAAARSAAEEAWAEQLATWQREWQRQLLPQWAATEVPGGDGAELVKLCRTIIQHYRRYEGTRPDQAANRLHEEFYNTRQTLLPYVPELEEDPAGRLLILLRRDRQNPLTPDMLLTELKAAEEEQRLLLSEKDRELYEEILIHSVGRAIKQKIARAQQWVKQMNQLMQARQTSSGFRLSLRWEPRAAESEEELDTEELVQLLRTDPQLLREEQLDRMVRHFRARIKRAQEESEAGDTLREWVGRLLDYRLWFHFTLYYEKGEGPRRELTDGRFNVLSGGEKAMAMYIPLFAAVYSRYNDANPEAPHLISLDEAFAGVDEENLRDMFALLTQMDLDYIMTSQHLWGCYDTVPAVSIYELYRPKDAPYVSLIHYVWNGRRRAPAADTAAAEAAAAAEEEGE